MSVMAILASTVRDGEEGAGLLRLVHGDRANVVAIITPRNAGSAGRGVSVEHYCTTAAFVKMPAYRRILALEAVEPMLAARGDGACNRAVRGAIAAARKEVQS